jgi:hypothetical protein
VPAVGDPDEREKAKAAAPKNRQARAHAADRLNEESSFTPMPRSAQASSAAACRQ